MLVRSTFTSGGGFFFGEIDGMGGVLGGGEGWKVCVRTRLKNVVIGGILILRRSEDLRT